MAVMPPAFHAVSHSLIVCYDASVDRFTSIFLPSFHSPSIPHFTATSDERRRRATLMPRLVRCPSIEPRHACAVEDARCSFRRRRPGRSMPRWRCHVGLAIAIGREPRDVDRQSGTLSVEARQHASSRYVDSLRDYRASSPGRRHAMRRELRRRYLCRRATRRQQSERCPRHAADAAERCAANVIADGLRRRRRAKILLPLRAER